MKKLHVKKGISLLLTMALLIPSIWAGALETEPDHAHDDAGINDIVNVDHVHTADCGHTMADTATDAEPGERESSRNVDIPEFTQPPKETDNIIFAGIHLDLLNEAISPEEVLVAATFMGREISDVAFSGILKDAEDRPLYLYAEFASGGYLIMLRAYNMPIEYSRDAECGPYSDRVEGNNYYLGMLAYAYEEAGEIKLVRSGQVLTQEDLQRSMSACDTMIDRFAEEFAPANNEGPAKVPSASPPQVDGPQLKIPLPQPLASAPVEIDDNFFKNAPFAENQGGDCGPVAASLLMRYYDKLSPGLVDTPPNIHMDTNWKCRLQSYSSTGNIQGTAAWDEVDLINVYLGENRKDAGYQAKWSLVPLTENLIDSGKPFVAYGTWSISADFHAVLVYGYETVGLGSEGASPTLKVHNGWHDTCKSYSGSPSNCSGGGHDGVYVHSYIIGSVLWLDTISSSHTHNFVPQIYDSVKGQHQIQCTGCGLRKMVAYHSYGETVDYGDYHLRICSVCNYRSQCDSIFNPATCTTPKTCNLCKASIGNKAPHTWLPATCVKPQTCSVCKTTTGTTTAHSWLAATCTTPQTCKTCGAKSGAALGHDLGPKWSDANHPHAYYNNCSRCKARVDTGTFQTKPHGTGEYGSGTCQTCGVHSYSGATCQKQGTCVCGAKSGYGSHNFSIAATCTSAKKCSVCGTTTGSALGHSYAAATCTSAQRCSRCGATTGTALGHSLGTTWSDASHPHAYYRNCSRCSTRVNTGSYATKSHGNGAYGSGTCPSCGSHKYVNATCTTKGTCSCGATAYGSHSYVTSGGVTRCKYCGLVKKSAASVGDDPLAPEEGDLLAPEEGDLLAPEEGDLLAPEEGAPLAPESEES